jgi:hypothetical protein
VKEEEMGEGKTRDVTMASSLRRVRLPSPSPSLRAAAPRPSLRAPTVPARRGLATPSGAQVRRAFGRLPGVFTALLAVGVCTTGFGLCVPVLI